MFCEAARAKENGEPYLLASLLPEVRTAADNLRRRVLEQTTRRGPKLVMHRPGGTAHALAADRKRQLASRHNSWLR
jgi:hypothetical protein